jgi:GTP-binding protein HflX
MLSYIYGGEIMDQAILVGIDIEQGQLNIKSNLDELEQLALAAQITTRDKIVQKAKTISPRFFIGSGKVKEIKKIIEVLDIDVVIFDDTLSSSQLSNLETELNVQVIDRSFLILSIFAERAQTKQAMLEVSLAQKLYMLPRLSGIGKTLSRQGGGSYNAKGPGETKLELDRRKILREITFIKEQLVKIEKEQLIATKKRRENSIPVVALVGYTNAGKSSLLNGLTTYLNQTQDPVFEKNMLFATLDTKARRIQQENKPPFILIDTVGFISKLPHELIRSFKTTLTDVLNADLLLHVVDATGDYQQEMQVTKNVLKEIQADNIERILVMTKKDLTLKHLDLYEDYLYVSNKTKENYHELISSIYGHLYKDTRLYQLDIPFDKGDIYHELKTSTTIINTIYHDQGIQVKVVLSPNMVAKYKQYIIL